MTGKANITKGANTPLELLAQWANDNDGWVRAIVSEIISTRRDLPDDVVDEAFQLFQAEKGLSAETARDVPLLDASGQTSGTAEKFLLVEMRDVKGVNALVDSQRLAFHEQLTILFGENASGKTGYVRVLKRLASVRGAEAILSNIHAKTVQAPPSATIDYMLGDERKSYSWTNDEGVRPFTRVAVFDARAVGLHVDEDLTYLFTPGDLSLFSQCHRAIGNLRDKLEGARKGRRRKDNPFLRDYSRGTKVCTLIETLGPSTELADLELAAQTPKDATRQVDTLQRLLDSLNPATVAARTSAASSQLVLLEEIRDALAPVATFERAEYQKALIGWRDAKEQHFETGEATFLRHGLKDTDQPEWRALLRAAEDFISKSRPAGYPGENDQCIYCNQSLEPEPRTLVTSYRQLLTSDLATEVSTRDRALRVAQGPLTELNVGPLLERIRRQLDDSPPKEDRFLPQVRQFLDALSTTIAALRDRSDIEETGEQNRAKELGKVLEARITAVRGVLQANKQEAEEREKKRQEYDAKLRELKDRMRLSQQLPEIRSYLEDAKWVSGSEPLLKRIGSVLRSLTTASKQASEEILNRDFEKRFRKECDVLRAPEVKLAFPGRQGQATRRKVIADEYRVSQIFSEGEQKVIALADFLAEAGLRQESSPVVFDDPVTSLDYRRIHEVVNRVIGLSQKRQVIVFTHNIWFASELRQKAGKGCSFFNVRDDGSVKGLVSHDRGPRTDTVSSLRKKINILIEDAKKLEPGTVQQALVEKAYDYVRSWCEVAVESVLLAGVVRRYEPNVRLTVLGQIDGDVLKKATSTIVPIFEKACRYIDAHSQPMEQLNVRPTMAELQEDWKALQDSLRKDQ